MADSKYEAFLAAANAGSFKRAAAELGYTQAGISYLVNALERELDVTLFVREYGGVQLTSDGADLLPWIQDIANAERRLSAHLADLKQLEGGTLRVVAFTSTLIQWLPGMAKRFTEVHPQVDLQLLYRDDQVELEDMLWRGDADVGFAVLPTKRELDTVPLVRDPLLVAVAADHPLARAKAFPTDALAREPYIKLESGRYSEMDKLFRVNGVEPAVRLSIDSDYAVMSLVNAGLGYSVLSGLVLRNAPFPLATMPAETPATRDIALALRSRSTASEATLAFLECAQAWIRDAYGKTSRSALLF